MIVIPDLHQIDGELRQPPPTPAHRWTGTEWVFDPDKQTELNQLECLKLCAAIDAVADATRHAIAGDALRVLEYEQAARDAKAFQEGGFPSGEVPLSVAAWVVNDRTARQAAEDILTKASILNDAVLRIRTVRLQGKEALRLEMSKGNVDAARQLADETITQINRLSHELAPPLNLRQ
ncbi:phage tail protein [Pseudomonas sp. NA-150]|uniref:phage tail protein n=1 Tax=Pseudomonas sp. NA-150 TaxID=3367525 RepID=UPI0037C54C0C